MHSLLAVYIGFFRVVIFPHCWNVFREARKIKLNIHTLIHTSEGSGLLFRAPVFLEMYYSFSLFHIYKACNDFLYPVGVGMLQINQWWITALCVVSHLICQRTCNAEDKYNQGERAKGNHDIWSAIRPFTHGSQTRHSTAPEACQPLPCSHSIEMTLSRMAL